MIIALIEFIKQRLALQNIAAKVLLEGIEMVKLLKALPMPVLSRMVLGKLLIFTLCTNCYAQSWDSPNSDDFRRSDSLPALVYNTWQTISGRISDSDKQKHEHAAYYALEHLDNGETIKWYNPRTNSNGYVQIAMTWMNGGQSCRRLYGQVQTEKFNRSFTDTACYNPSTNAWRFLDKY